MVGPGGLKKTGIRAGVLGWPVAHSRSPILHGYWLDYYGIDGHYEPIAVPPEELEKTLRSLPGKGFAGVNITVPHKQTALAVMDECDATARKIGAVNTVDIDHGRLRGRNTDGFGFMENLNEKAPKWREVSGPAVVLGAGGAARAICLALLEAGVGDIRLVNRSQSKAHAMAVEFGDFGAAPLVMSWDRRAQALHGAALLVNGTSLGMTGQPPLEIALDALPSAAVVYDIVYAPLHTPLLLAAARRGHRVVDGLGMLIHQARPGFEAWFGVRPKVTAELRELLIDDLQRETP